MSTLILKGPHWVTVRQHRRTLLLAAVVIAVSPVAMLALRGLAGWEGTPYGHAYDLLRSGMKAASLTMLFLPVLVGAFFAGPMIARELESGTYRLALTQSCTPRAWLSAKFVVAAVAAVTGSAALVGAYRLGWSRLAGTYQFHWADRGAYEATGPVVVAYCLLGIAIGAVTGLLVRRTLPAMAVAGLVTGLVMPALGALRWSFLPVQTLTAPLTSAPGKSLPLNAFVMESGYTTTTGVRLPFDACVAPVPEQRECLAALDVVGRFTDYHPASHYWPTQLIESSIALALAVLAGYAAFRILRSRHG
ncbi:ABC transporter permease subunit [Streptomyces sp. NPDC090022]|uniref:ABC transporter permease subunit n=1 Tax=Streptomyces sp. NPDC090022 TaxID=3365920 RepID=UPI00382880C3